MSHLRRFQVERLLTDDLSAQERASLEAHLEGCAECRNAVESERAALEKHSPPPLDAALDRHRRDASLSPPALGIRRAAMVMFAVAAAVSLFIGLTRSEVGEDPSQPMATERHLQDRLKGLVVTLHRERGGQVTVLGPGGTVRAGDRLRFSIRSPTRGHVAVVAVSGEDAELWYPAAGETLRADPGEALTLPGSIELTSGDEHSLYVLLTPQRVGPERLRAAAREASQRGLRSLEIESLAQTFRVLRAR